MTVGVTALGSGWLETIAKNLCQLNSIHEAKMSLMLQIKYHLVSE